MLELTFLLGISVLETPECSLTTSLAELVRPQRGRRCPAAGGEEVPRCCLCRCWVGAAAAIKGEVSGLYRHRHTNILKRQSKQPLCLVDIILYQVRKTILPGAPSPEQVMQSMSVSGTKTMNLGSCHQLKITFLKKLLLKVLCFFSWLFQQPDCAEHEDLGNLTSHYLSCYC